MKLKKNITGLSDKKLINYSADVFEALSSHLDDEDIELLNHLLEVEREITTRETY